MFLAVNKKADGNMFWIIIGAVIALVVLIILLIIFSSKTSLLETGLMNCENKGGICKAGGGCSGTACDTVCTGVSGGSYSYSSTFSCPTKNDICCLGVKDSSK